MKRNRTHLRLAVGALILLIGAPALAQTTGGLDLTQGNAFAPADLSTFGGRPEPRQGYFFSASYLHWGMSEPWQRPIGSENSRIVYTDVQQFPTIPPYSPPDSPGQVDFTFYFPVSDPPLYDNLFDLYYALIGYDQGSEASTAFIGTEFQSGMRYEFGRVVGHHGWIISTYQIRPDTQTAQFVNTPVSFEDPQGLLFGQIGSFQAVIGVNVTYERDAGGVVIGRTDTPIIQTFRADENIGVTFSQLNVRNRQKTWAVEAAYVYRSHRNHFRAPSYLKVCRPLERVFDGSIFEWYFGGRYQEIDGRFIVQGVGGTLGNSNWDTRADNNIVGPMLGLRWYKQHDRFTLSTEGRFVAGYNRQNFIQTGHLGTNVVVGGVGNFDAWPGGPFSHKTHSNEFSPLVELRMDLKYQVTRALSLNVGWNGTWIDGVARASSVVRYEVPRMGIDTSGDRNRESFFMHGLVIGAEINR